MVSALKTIKQLGIRAQGLEAESRGRAACA